MCLSATYDFNLVFYASDYHFHYDIWNWSLGFIWWMLACNIWMDSFLFLFTYFHYFLFLFPLSHLYFLFSFSPSTTCSIVPILFLFQYMEKVPGGGSVFRSSRAESKQEQRHEVLQQEAVEKLYNKLQASFESCFPKQGSYSLPQLNLLYLRPQFLNISFMQHFIKII